MSTFEIMHELQRRGYAVEIHDPHRDDLNRPLEVVCARADLLLIATDHKVYREECASS